MFQYSQSWKMPSHSVHCIALNTVMFLTEKVNDKQFLYLLQIA